jgi:hypothetical protein
MAEQIEVLVETFARKIAAQAIDVAEQNGRADQLQRELDALRDEVTRLRAVGDRVRMLEGALRDASELAHAASMAALDDKARSYALRLARRIDATLAPAPPAASSANAARDTIDTWLRREKGGQ